MSEKVRLDKYLWSIRIFKTRTLATAAIDSGKVKCKGEAVKASRAVSVGDQYEIKTPARKWIIEIVGIISNRVAYEIAKDQYVDLTPIEEQQVEKPLVSSFYTGKRLSKTGRPTKKQRRDLNDLLGDQVEIEA
jgi:ribosome-associated heat shock protein Hsp15